MAQFGGVLRNRAQCAAWIAIVETVGGARRRIQCLSINQF